MNRPGDPEDYRTFGGAYADPVTGEMMGGKTSRRARRAARRAAKQANAGSAPGAYDPGGYPAVAPDSPGAAPYDQSGYAAPSPYDQGGYPGTAPYDQGGYPAAAPDEQSGYSAAPPSDQSGYPAAPPDQGATSTGTPYGGGAAAGTGYGGGAAAGGPYGPGGYPVPGAPYGPGGYPGAGMPPRPPNRRMIMLPVVIGGGTLLIVIGVMAFLLLGNHDRGRRASGPTDTAQVPPPPAPSGPSTTAATVPGWQGVLSTRDGLAYDVPKSWKVSSPGVIAGFEQPDPGSEYGSKPFIAGHAVAEFPGRCTGNGTYRAQTVVLSVDKLPVERAAAAAAARWTQGATMAENGAVHQLRPPPAHPLRLADGTAAAEATITDTTQDQSGKCPAPKVTVTTVALPTKSGTAVLVVSGDAGVPDAVDAATLSRIARSVRPTR